MLNSSSECLWFSEKIHKTWPQWGQWGLPLRKRVALALAVLLSTIFANWTRVGQVRPWAHSNTNVRFSLRWKRLPCTVQQPRQMRLAHSPNPLIFPKTNYPGVRDLTHKFRTAGEFSDSNHTSMLVPLNNRHCLSLAPALFQLCIDYYPALALYCDPVLSAVPLTLCPRGARKTASRSLGSREQSARVMISSWNCHWFCDMLMPSLSLSGERNEQIVWSWQSSIGVCRTMLMASGVKPRWSINS